MAVAKETWQACQALETELGETRADARMCTFQLQHVFEAICNADERKVPLAAMRAVNPITTKMPSAHQPQLEACLKLFPTPVMLAIAEADALVLKVPSSETVAPKGYANKLHPQGIVDNLLCVSLEALEGRRKQITQLCVKFKVGAACATYGSCLCNLEASIRCGSRTPFVQILRLVNWLGTPSTNHLH
eukprot:2682259-Amphidinium_carterae.1